MKNIYQDVKAGAIPLIAIIVVVILVAVAVFVISPTTATEYWETESEFGFWREEIEVVYEDGTTESLKMLQEQITSPFTVYYEGKSIWQINVKLYASVSGEVYDGAELKFNSFGWDTFIKVDGSWNRFDAYEQTYDVRKVELGKTVKLYETFFSVKSKIDEHPETYPDGSYDMKFVAGGEVEYRGYPDGGAYETATNPPTRTIRIEVRRQPTGSIRVTLSSEAVGS